MANKKVLTLIIVLMAIMGFSMAVLGTSFPSQSAASTQKASSSSSTGETPLIPNLQNSIGNLSGSNNTLKQSSNLNANASYNHGFSRNNLFLPNPSVKSDYSIQNSIIKPTYTSGPAPVGVSDIGIKNSSGSMKAYNLSTNGIEGSIIVNSMSAFYPLNEEAGNVTFQLNTVLKNVTILGNDSFSYWTQNVVRYSTTQHTICFEDNIWNFSSGGSIIKANTIYNSTGNVLPYYGVHIASGPTYKLTLPFTLNLYINSSIVDNMNAVWFNYSIPQMGAHGTYDRVLFNSSYGEPSTFHTKQSDFFISGSTPTPSGSLYDAEFIIGGPGGGSNTNIMNINATMQLMYMNATTKTMTSVPSAINFGVDTGETSVGISTYWTSNDVVHLSQGPTFLEYMWGISSANHEGFMKITGSVSQSSAFLFISNNATNLPIWTPLTLSGKFTYLVSPGDYSSVVLLNNYNISVKQSKGTAGSVILWNFDLNKTTSEDLYTPVYAFNNKQLKADSIYGNGTTLSPYVMPDVRNSNQVNVLFGETNDFAFPVFSTYELVNTTSVTSICQSYILVLSAVYNNEVTSYPVALPVVFYDTSNIMILGLYMYSLPSQIPNANGFYYSMIDIYYSTAMTLAGITMENTQYPFFVFGSSNIAIIDSFICDPYTVAIISCYSSLSTGLTYLSLATVCSYEGHLNLTDVKSYKSTIFASFSNVNYFGKIICDSEVDLANSNLTLTGVTICNTDIFLSHSSAIQRNVQAECLSIFGTYSTIAMDQSTVFCEFYLELANSTISLDQSSIVCFCGHLFDSHATVSDSQVISPSLCVADSTFSINQASDFTSGEVYFVHSTTEVLSSYINSTYFGVCYGHFKAVDSTFSTERFTNNPWKIITVFANTMYEGDTFLTLDFNGYSFSAQNLLDAIEVVGGINSIENSLFYSSNSNLGSSLQILSGNNTVTGNIFESKNICTCENANGGGSALITYGGNNQISGNSFITLSPGGQSLYIQDGDISTQSANSYLYDVNFTESGLAYNSTWSLSIGGHAYTSSSNYINVLLSTGTYTYTTSSTGYSGQSGTVKVASSAIIQHLSFNKLAKYSVTFQESGLPKLTNWTITFDGQVVTTSAQTIAFTGVTTGTYAYSTGSFSKYYGPASASGNVSVTSNMTQTIDFSGVMYAISFHESGLNSKANWTVVVNGTKYFSDGLSTITLNAPIGSTLTYIIGNQTGYVSSIKNGNFPVSGNYTVAVQFVKSGISPTLTYIGIAIAAIVGLVVGGGAAIYLSRVSIKKTTK